MSRHGSRFRSCPLSVSASEDILPSAGQVSGIEEEPDSAEDFEEELSSDSRDVALDERFSGWRLDAAVSEAAGISRSQAQKWIKSGAVSSLDGSLLDPSSKIKKEMTVRVCPPPLAPAVPQPEAGVPLDIVYEDSSLVVLCKRRGQIVHPGAGVYSGTIVNGLLAHCSDLSGIGGVERPGIVHRLDKDTSGLMVVSKDDASHIELCRQFAAREVTKFYQALVYGVPSPLAGIIEQPIGRHPSQRKCMAVRAGGRYAKTEYKVEEAFGKSYSWLKIHLFTGRTHQIRVHLSWMGHPLVGDPVYKPHSNPWNLTGQALHCCRLEFVHPRSGERMAFEAPPPQEILDILQELRTGRS